MKKLFEDIRRQNTPDLSLDEKILERARTMRAGKKEMLSAEGKEHIEMKVSMNKAAASETAIVRKNHGALIAAAAALVMVVGGTVAAVMNGKMSVEPVSTPPASEQSTNSECIITPVSDSSEAEDTPTVTTFVYDEEAPAEISEKDLIKDWAKPYLEKNPDTVGYIHIPGFDSDGELKIDCPVVQRSGMDWSFYLDHDFYKQEYSMGAIVAPDMRGRTTITAVGQPWNVVLYGHNLFNELHQPESSLEGAEHGMMFSGLGNYEGGDDFYKKHALIDFKTIYQDDGEYVIFAIVDHETEDGAFTADAFNYDEEYSFDEWLSRVRNESSINCDIECTPEDKYLTLLTPYDPEDHQRAVIAKKLTPQDDKQAIIDSVRTNNVNNDEGSLESEETGIETRIEIPVPEGIRGSYTFDLYRDGSVIATKTIADGEEYAGTFVSMDIVVYGSETLAIYVKSNDLGEENYIHYGKFDIEIINGQVIGDVKVKNEDILRITPTE